MYKCFRLPTNLEDLINDIFDYSMDNEDLFRRYNYQESNGKDTDETQAEQLIHHYKENIIDGDETSKRNFPIEEVDIFISHAHKDEELAYKLAYLLRGLGLKCFIDSSVWNKVDDLIKELDVIYALNPGGETYDYLIRNITTTHGHLMLSSALVEMINRCECFFFIDTENSIYHEDNMNYFTAKTYSPWIKLEIDTARIIKRKYPRGLKRVHESKSISTEDAAIKIPKFIYPLSLEHLVELEADDFISWIRNVSPSNKDKHPLDILYSYYN